MSDARAQHWHRWFAINVFWLVFVVVTFALMGTFGFDTTGRFALSIPTSFVQLCDPAGDMAAAEKPTTSGQYGGIGAAAGRGCSASISRSSG